MARNWIGNKKVTKDDMNRNVKGLGRDPDLYE